MHEDVFRDLHREILARDTHDPNWNEHRTFAVDGSKLNLPRPLVEAGYPLPNDGAHYPQGLLSCLYRLDNRMPADFLLTPDADERAAARTHLDALSPGDVVVLDRGYFSFVMLHAMIARGLHPVFRIQRNSAAAFDRFRDGDRDDARVRVTPGKDALRSLKAAGIPAPGSPAVLRLVRYDIGESRYVLATTFADPERYSVKDLSALYHGRWGIEEMYGPAIVFEIENQFDFRGGPALRHQTAHGLVSGEACHEADAIYACWFMFPLCCLHVFEHWDELAEWMDGTQDPESGTASPESSDVVEGAAENQEHSSCPAKD